MRKGPSGDATGGATLGSMNYPSRLADVRLSVFPRVTLNHLQSPDMFSVLDSVNLQEPSRTNPSLGGLPVSTSSMYQVLSELKELFVMTVEFNIRYK